MSSTTDTNQPDHIVDMHEMVTDTNQASEDELKTKAPDSSSEAGNTIIPQLYGYCLEVGLELSNYQAVELTKLTQKLIRTEKLKAQMDILQEGVSESKEFCGEDVDISLGWVNFKLNKLQQLLTKLEAEL